MSDTRLSISAADARRLVMNLQGLSNDPDRPGAGKPAAISKLIHQMGFVQIDTISVVDRAHHLILSTRASDYAPEAIHTLAGRQKKLFEHWTHDASYIPTEFFPHWRYRFERSRNKSWAREQLGQHADRITQQVLDRIRTDGPMKSSHFEHEGPRGAANWWNWKPAKLALDYLWRIGELYIVARDNFQKVYDLTERAAPHLHRAPTPDREAFVDWVCTSALQRLGYATVNDLWKFWNLIDVATARQWANGAIKAGRVVEVDVQCKNGEAPRRAIALPDIKTQLRRAKPSPAIARLLCPFDPVVRDRTRLHRLFDFEYRFEAFVPASKRVHGYYVMPLLLGDRLIGRVDPKVHRDQDKLEIKGVWWQPDSGPTRERKRHLAEAAERLAAAVGVRRIDGI